MIEEATESTRVFKPSLAYAVFKRGFSAFGLIIFIFLFSYNYFHASQFALLFILALVFGVVAGAVYGYLWRQFSSYEAREDGVMRKTGIISRSQSLFLYSQIQGVKENRDIIDYLIGTCTLQASTMSVDSSAFGELSGLHVEDARELRDLIMSAVNASTPAKRSAADKETRAAALSSFKRSGLPLKELEGAPYPIHSKKVFLFAFLVSFAIALFVTLLVTYVSPAEMQNQFFWPAVFAGCFIFGLVIGAFSLLQTAPYSYAFSSEWLQIKYSFLQQKVLNCRFDRIQNVVVRESFPLNTMGLVSLEVETGEQVMTTGRTSEPKMQVPALAIEDALAIKNSLLRRMNVDEGSYVNLREQYPLEAVKPIKKTINVFVYLVLFASVFLLYMSFQSDWKNTQGILVIGGTLLVLLLTVLELVYQWFYYSNYAYKTSKTVLMTRKGVLGFVSVFVPYSRVQNVFVDNDILDRVFNLRDTHLSTIGQISANEMHVDGVNPANAEEIKELFLELVKENQA